MEGAVEGAVFAAFVFGGDLGAVGEGNEALGGGAVLPHGFGDVEGVDAWGGGVGGGVGEEAGLAELAGEGGGFGGFGVGDEAVEGGGGAVVGVDDVAIREAAEGDDFMRGVGDFFVAANAGWGVGIGVGVVEPEGPDFAGFVVAIDVGAVEGGEAGAGVGVAAGDGGGFGVGVDDEGWGDGGEGAEGVGFDRLGGFGDAPAVVAAGFDEADHFPEFPADVTTPEAAGGVEGDFPGVAEAEGVDFRADVGFAEEGVVGGDGVGEAGGGVVDVEAEDGGEEVGVVLTGVAGVGRRGDFGVAGGEVEFGVGAELEVGAVVTAGEPCEEDFFGGGVDDEGVE